MMFFGMITSQIMMHTLLLFLFLIFILIFIFVFVFVFFFVFIFTSVLKAMFVLLLILILVFLLVFFMFLDFVFWLELWFSRYSWGSFFSLVNGELGHGNKCSKRCKCPNRDILLKSNLLVLFLATEMRVLVFPYQRVECKQSSPSCVDSGWVDRSPFLLLFGFLCRPQHCEDNLYLR